MEFKNIERVINIDMQIHICNVKPCPTQLMKYIKHDMTKIPMKMYMES